MKTTVIIHDQTNPAPEQHNYMKKLMRMVQNGQIKPESFRDAYIAHDSWCEIHRGGFCNCDPDIKFK